MESITPPLYTYGDKDITFNVCLQIKDVINIISVNENISFMEAATLFYKSQTIEDLKNTDNGLWAESAEYIADQFYEEKASAQS